LVRGNRPLVWISVALATSGCLGAGHTSAPSLNDELLGDAYTIGQNGSFTVKNEEAEKTMRRYVGMLDAMRQIGNLLGGGPVGGGAGD